MQNAIAYGKSTEKSHCKNSENEKKKLFYAEHVNKTKILQIDVFIRALKNVYDLISMPSKFFRLF